MIGFLAILFGVAPLGWCDYCQVAGPDGSTTKVCVVVRCFHIFWMPLIPLKAYVVIEPSSSICACRGEMHVAHFKSCCSGGYLMKAYCWAWLRFLCFGLLACCEPSCSDPEALMAELAVRPGGGAVPATGSSSGGNNSISAAPSAVVTSGDNRAAGGGMYGATAAAATNGTVPSSYVHDNKQREVGANYQAAP